MPDQLTIDGGSVPYPLPPPRHLTERQRRLVRYLRFYVEQKARPFPTAEAVLYFADPSGALRRLEALGLVERIARGYWRATT